MNRQDTVIIEVEDFIKKFHDGEIAIAPEAQNLQVARRIKGKLGVSSENLGNLADLLGKAIARYEAFKDTPTVFLKMDAALDLLDLIERARTLRVIVPQNLTNKLKECQEQNNQLKEEKDKLEKVCQKLKEENRELHRTLDHFGERGNISEVKDSTDE